ncbi:ribonuclease P protein component [bacterium]|nr:ribonuclease P protein component [bacterium]MBR6244400.1 ribonuclease P protein component [bacterium]
MDFSFSKQDKIRKNHDYSCMKSDGLVFKTRLIVFNYAESDRMRLGVIVTKKVGNAVVRNRTKRWIREVFRLNRDAFSRCLDIVVIPRRSDLSFGEIKRDFLFFAEKYNGKISNISGKAL